MPRTRFLLALLAGLIGCASALGLAGTAALAADLPAKAPPPAAAPPPPPSNWSAFLQVGYEWGQMNPQGQAVYKDGDYQFVGGANLTLYKSKDGFINNWTVGGIGIADFTAGTFGPSNSLWASSNPTQGGNALYFILGANTNITFGQYWTLSEEFFHFDGANANGSGPTNPAAISAGGVNGSCVITTGIATGAPLGCENLPSWSWNEVKLSLSDGPITNWPISFNPYVTWWYEFYPSGYTGVLGTTTSAACFSCNSEHTDFIIGMTPTLALQKYINLPVILTAPTWFTVGPKSFWEGNAGGGPGSGCVINGPNCSTSNIGVFTTGLTATWLLTSVPVQYGHWALKAGFQWFDLVNKALQGDNLVTYGGNPGGSLPQPFRQDITTAFVSLGVGF